MPGVSGTIRHITGRLTGNQSAILEASFAASRRPLSVALAP